MKKDKAVSWLIRIFSLAILFGTIVWTTTKTGVISLVGTEDVYWERARFLLGQGGASLYDGSSICSLGYSLILMPICALIKSPYAAYKTAVLLNGIFLCAGYLVAVAAAKKLFPRESENFLSAACFFAVFTPALMISKTYTGPEMAVLLLTWVSIYLLVSIWEKSNSRKIAALAACMILIGFLQITALGLILAVVILLGLYIKEKRLEENTFLYFLLAVLLGLAAGNIAERAVLSAFAADMDLISVRPSLEVLIDGFSAFASEGWLTGFISTVVGKLYSVLIASFLLVCPAFWYFSRTLIRRDRAAYREALPELGIIGIFLIQFIWICMYDNSLGIEAGMLPLSGLEMLLPPLILIGIVRIKNAKVWDRQMPVYLLLLCICTFATAGAIQANKLEAEDFYLNSGFLVIFQSLEEPIGPTAIYMAAFVVMLIAVVLAFLLVGDKKKHDGLLKTAGTAAALIVFAVINVLTAQQSIDTLTETNLNTVAPVASLITDTDTESDCVYIGANENEDETDEYEESLAVLQSLMPQKQIRVSRNSDKVGLTEKNPVILTASDQTQIQDTYQKELPGYQIVYMTEKFSLWAQKDSAVLEEIEVGVERRMETLSSAPEGDAEEEEDEEEEAAAEEETEDSSKQSVSQKYAGSLPLAAGTYHIEVHLHEKKKAEGTGTLTVLSGKDVLSEQTFDESIFDDNGDGIVALELTSRNPMWKVSVTVKGSLLNDVSIKRVSCRKMNDRYTVALEEEEQAKSTANAVLSLDFNVETTGTVAYLDSFLTEPDDVSLEVFEEKMPGYSLEAVPESELADVNADYLIADTAGHAYQGVMDRYSIISMNDSFTVLVCNDSDQYQTYVEHGGQVLSDETKIDIHAFTGVKKNTSPITLSSGDYLYHVNVSFDEENLDGEDSEVAGIVRIVNKNSILTEKEITYSDLRNCGSNQLDVEIPLNLSSKKSKVRCTIEVFTTALTSVEPVSVELVSEKYQYGEEEENIGELLDLINTLPEGTTVSVVQTEKNILNQSAGYEWLEEQIPGCQVQEISGTAAIDMTEDGVLLTYGLRRSTLNLLYNYSILGHTGRYTLWANTNGENLQQLVSASASVLSSARKISPASLAAMHGSDSEDPIAYLPSLEYTIYLKLTVQDLEEDDTIEATLYRDKNEEEIEEELEELLSSGYEEEEALDLIDPQISCGSKTIEAYEFGDSDNVLVKIKKADKYPTSNLYCDAYTWKQGEVEAEIVWVEVN